MKYSDPDDTVMLLDWMFRYAKDYEYEQAEEKKLYDKKNKAKKQDTDAKETAWAKTTADPPRQRGKNKFKKVVVEEPPIAEEDMSSNQKRKAEAKRAKIKAENDTMKEQE
jgi:hypothetical protein